jgi:tRNA dimethylallyltransferase
MATPRASERRAPPRPEDVGVQSRNGGIVPADRLKSGRQHAETVLGAPIFIAGPTAVGKSEVALVLAEQISGEIISVDSMQVYRGLDLGTAKPGAAARKRVPHHLIDVVELTEPFDAAKFARLAHQAVAEIRSRGRVPILCGGTGFYFKAFLEGLGEAPAADARLRAELEAMPLDDLLRELEQRDSATFAKIDRQNPRRVIRAVEVIRLTGKPFSAQRARWGEAADEPTPSPPSPTGERAGKRWSVSSKPLSLSLSPLGGARENIGSRGRSPHQPVFFGLSRSAADLHARIHARVDQMFAAGLVEETRRLLGRGLEQNQTALQALGYRQVVEQLRGERSLDETIELVKTKTRQFAKRQLTWFRRQLDVEWIELAPTDKPEAVAALVKARLAE